jgi:hypothetical protein
MTFNCSCCSCQVVTVYCFSSLVNHLICKFPVVDVQFVGDVFFFSIGADFAGATGASAPAQFLQRGLSPLTYDAARDGRGGEGRDIQPPHT